MSIHCDAYSKLQLTRLQMFFCPCCHSIYRRSHLFSRHCITIRIHHVHMRTLVEGFLVTREPHPWTFCSCTITSRVLLLRSRFLCGALRSVVVAMQVRRGRSTLAPGLRCMSPSTIIRYLRNDHHFRTDDFIGTCHFQPPPPTNPMDMGLFYRASFRTHSLREKNEPSSSHSDKKIIARTVK